MQIAYVCRAVGSYGWSMQAEHAVLAVIPACFVAAAEASSAFRCARSAVRALHAAGLRLMVSAMQLAGEPHGGPAGAERAVLEPEQPVRGGHRQLPLHTDGSQHRRRHRHKTRPAAATSTTCERMSSLLPRSRPTCCTCA